VRGGEHDARADERAAAEAEEAVRADGERERDGPGELPARGLPADGDERRRARGGARGGQRGEAALWRGEPLCAKGAAVVGGGGGGGCGGTSRRRGRFGVEVGR
jgi:hypothetical protein